MKKIILFIFIIFIGIINSRAAVGDYRTRAGVTGNWNATNVWQKYYNPGGGNGWYDVTSFPTSADLAITVLSGCNITITADINLDEVNVKGNLTLNAGVTLTINDGSGTDVFVDNTSSNYANFYVYGIIINQGTLSKLYGTIYYYDNSTYKHAQNGGSVEDAAWSTNSTCEITGITTSNVTNLDQSFGNFTWNCPSQTAILNLPTLGVIYGNFTLTNTGSGGIKLSETADVSLTVYGNYIQTSGNFYPAGSSANNIFYLYGNFSLSGGFISSPGTGSCTFNFSNSTPSGGAQTYSKTGGSYYQKVHFVVSNAAILDMGNSIIDNSSSGNFTINSGCGLKTMNINGITANGSSGCIQLTGTRSYDPGSHYTFYANGNQSSGYQFSAAVTGSVTIGSAANTTNFTVTSPTQIDGSFIIIKGTVANSNLSYGSEGTLEYRGTASQTMGSNEWPSSTVPNLKINNSYGVIMNTSKTLSSTLYLTSGALSIGSGNTLNLNEAISTSSGSITGGSSSNINIGGSVSTNLPGVTNGLGNLTINRSGYTISLTGGITVYGTMTMTAGTFALNGGTLSYGSSGTLKYNGSGTAQTCSNAEFPVSNGPFNLYTDNSSGVNLHAGRTLNGTLTLNNGEFSIVANTLTINGFIVKNSGSLTGSSSSNILFGENASITSLPAVSNGLNNLSVNRSGGIQVTGAVTVYGTLTLTSGSITLSGGSIGYGSNGILQYDGITTQTTANAEFPSFNGPKQLISNNINGMILHANRSLNGTLSLQKGNLDLNGKTITLYDNISVATGTISGSTTSGIDFEGTTASTSIPNSITLQNLTINRLNGISMAGAVTVEGALNLSSGVLSIGNNTLTINGIISQTSGGLSGTATSNITFGSSGVATILPGTTVGKLSINRLNGVSMTGSVTVQNTLNIGAGNLNISNNTLTINGSVVGTSLAGGNSSNLTVSGGFTAPNITIPVITLNSFILSRANGISLGGNMDIYGNATITNGIITPGGYQLVYHGSSPLTYNGSSPQTTSNAEFPSGNGPYSLNIINISGVNLHSSRNIPGTLMLANGIFTLNANTLTISGSSPARLNGSIDASNHNATIAFENSTPVMLPASVFTGDINNLTLNGTGGVTMSSDITVNGVLLLQSDNPSVNKGILDMWNGAVMKTLTMGLNATTAGTGDVTGIVKRTSFAENIPYTFGNRFTTVTLGPGGTYPTELQAKISIGTIPPWKPSAINRIYEFIQTGGIGCDASITTHYLDTELNGNNENELVGWNAQLHPLVVEEKGRLNYNTTDNWVSLPASDISGWATSFGEEEYSLAKSDTLSWNGSQSTSWFTNENWTPAGVPTNTSVVIIPDASATPNSPALSAFSEVKDLTINANGLLAINSNGRLTIDNVLVNNAGIAGMIIKSDASGYGSLLHHNNSIPATVERYIADTTWNLVSSPFEQGDGARAGLLVPSGGDAYLRPYTDGTDWGDYITSLDYQFIPLQGYAIWLTQGKTLGFSGLLMNGVINKPLVNGTNNWNLVGNPYPSSLDWELVERYNTSASMYLWDNNYAGHNNGNYKTYNALSHVGVPSSTTKNIPSFQGFFVQATDISASITYNNSARLHSDQPFYKELTGQTRVLVRLKITDTHNLSDELLVCSNQDANNDFDEFDSRKMSAGSNVPEIFTMAHNEQLVINAVKSLPAVIPVNIKVSQTGTFTLKAFDLILDANITVRLEDTQSGSMTDLRNNPENTIGLTQGENSNRFFLHIGSPDNINDVENNSLNILVSDNQVTIYVSGSIPINQVSIYDLSGREIARQEGGPYGCMVNTAKISKGVYFVKVMIGKDALTRKVIIY